MMLVATILASCAACLLGPNVAAAASEWADARLAARSVVDPAAGASAADHSSAAMPDVFGDIAFAAVSSLGTIPGPVLAVLLFCAVFWEGRYVSFWLLRRLIARGPRWERAVTGFTCEYHSPDAEVRRKARALYGFNPHLGGLIGDMPAKRRSAISKTRSQARR